MYARMAARMYACISMYIQACRRLFLGADMCAKCAPHGSSLELVLVEAKQASVPEDQQPTSDTLGERAGLVSSQAKTDIQ